MGTFVFFSVSILFIVILVALVKSLNKGKSQKRKHDDSADTVHPVDDTEDVLFTGIILGGMLDNDSSGDSDSGGSDGGDGGGFDGGGFDGGGFDGGGFE